MSATVVKRLQTLREALDAMAAKREREAANLPDLGGWCALVIALSGGDLQPGQGLLDTEGRGLAEIIRQHVQGLPLPSGASDLSRGLLVAINDAVGEDLTRYRSSLRALKAPLSAWTSADPNRANLLANALDYAGLFFEAAAYVAKHPRPRPLLPPYRGWHLAVATAAVLRLESEGATRWVQWIRGGALALHSRCVALRFTGAPGGPLPSTLWQEAVAKHALPPEEVESLVASGHVSLEEVAAVAALEPVGPRATQSERLERELNALPERTLTDASHNLS